MSKEPSRLVDDLQRATDLRAALRSAADSLHPECDLDAGALRLEAAIRTGAIPPEPPVPGPIALARIASPAGWTLGFAIVGIASLLMISRVTRSNRARETATTTVIAVPSAVVVAAPAPVIAAVDPPAAARELPSIEPASIAVVEPVNPSQREHSTARAVPAPTAAIPAWRAEMLQLERARTLLPADPASALGVIRASQRAYPSGLYGEERDAIEIQALAALGRSAEVHTRAERFLARHPRGPFSERVRALSTPGGSR